MNLNLKNWKKLTENGNISKPLYYEYKIVFLNLNNFYRYFENRKLIARNLFSINRCIVQLLELRNNIYSDITFVNIKELANKKESFDLTEFIVSVFEKLFMLID